MKVFISVIILLFFFSNLQAQSPENQSKLNIDFVKFFEGIWVGEGQFSNGRKIEAEVSFKLSLDSCWLVYSHNDKAPNHYKAMSVWGIDKATGKLLDYVFDNFQGHRLFISNGWEQNMLLLTEKEFTPANGVIFQRFIYLKTGANKFKMSYEIS